MKFKFFTDNIIDYNVYEEMVAGLLVHQIRNSLSTETARHFFYENGDHCELKILDIENTTTHAIIRYRIRNNATLTATIYNMELQYRILNRLLDATI